MLVTLDQVYFSGTGDNIGEKTYSYMYPYRSTLVDSNEIIVDNPVYASAFGRRWESLKYAVKSVDCGGESMKAAAQLIAVVVLPAIVYFSMSKFVDFKASFDFKMIGTYRVRYQGNGIVASGIYTQKDYDMEKWVFGLAVKGFAAMVFAGMAGLNAEYNAFIENYYDSPFHHKQWIVFKRNK